jgi:polyisoprenoid-binding protein YceI
MKYFFLALFMAAGVPAGATEQLPVDASHSAVIFQWNHFGFSNPVARLEKVDGMLELDRDDLTRSSVSIRMALDGLRTGDDALDKRLKGADFLDAARYPDITFKSTRVERDGADKLKITGELSVHGVTKSVVLNAKLNKIAPNPFTKMTTVGFDADTMLRRSDFGVDRYVPAVTDELQVHITLAAEMHPKAQ